MKKQLEELLRELDKAYQLSDNKNNEYCKKHNLKWGYELIQTSLKYNEPMIIGFNWGVHNKWVEYLNGIEYEHQTNIDVRKILKIRKASIKRSIYLINKYFPNVNLENGSSSNFCFFRSEKEDQITKNDISLCIPIFNKLIEIVNPSIIFCFSSKARDHMIINKIVHDVKKKKISSSLKAKKGCIVAFGLLSNGTKVYFLPHPNNPISNDVRKKAWEFCSECK